MDEGGAPWIEWRGGDCPVDGPQMVHVRYRSGEEQLIEPTAASWAWYSGRDPDEIVAYRPVA